MSESPYQLRVERLGPLPVVNAFLGRLGLEETLERRVPTEDSRCRLSHAQALGVLLRSIIVEREPIYRQGETVQAFAPGLFGVAASEFPRLDDDRIGRALDRLFDADRGALLTDVVVQAAQRFDIRLDRLHNDTTSIALTGQYRRANGRRIRGKRAPWITYGYSKDHRPDLKQLIFLLTTTADGGVPVQFRREDGNASDSLGHVQTWDTLCQITGKSDFLYVADSKLCSQDNLEHIDKHKGRFVTVLPRTRMEDAQFRKEIQKREPEWELVWDRPHPRRKYGPRDRWWVYKDPIPSCEAWPIIWVNSSLLALKQDQTRREQLARAKEALVDLKARLAAPKSRIRKAPQVQKEIQEILGRVTSGNYLEVHKTRIDVHRFKQQQRGRPSSKTTYRRITRRRWDVVWTVNEEQIAYDKKSDGMFPLLTNDKHLKPSQVLEAYKGQPVLEKRFEQCKTVHEIAPVLLKNEGRIEALFFLYFLALLVQALIERELRRAMKKEKINELPLYPEERQCKHPTTEQILRLFSLAQRNVLIEKDKVIQTFESEFTPLQRQVLHLLEVPAKVFQSKDLQKITAR
jgi:transposase